MKDGLRVAALVCFAFLALQSCTSALGVISPASGSLGTPSEGVLVKEVRLSDRGSFHRCYHPGERRYGVLALVRAVERAAASVARQFPDSLLQVGDLSQKGGGRISGHASHRSGRDVDFAFYTADAAGRPASGVPLARFDRFGVASRKNRAVRFDVAKNWALVSALLSDPEADVQWLFVSDGLKALLLEWAAAHEQDLELAARAAEVLFQPSDSGPHDDHFHLRIACPTPDADALCADQAPIWPWITARRAERGVPPMLLSQQLAGIALEGL